MKVVLTVLGCALAVILVLALAGGQISVDLGSLGSGSGGGPGSAGSGSGEQSPENRRPPVTTNPAPKSVGTPNVTFRGTDGTERVDCSDIVTEFKVSAFSGRIRWTATSDPGVSVSPSSGELEDGQDVLVSIRGADADGDSFEVIVSAPNRAGSAAVGVTFTCV
jgi:hypothetical protein